MSYSFDSVVVFIIMIIGLNVLSPIARDAHDEKWKSVWGLIMLLWCLGGLYLCWYLSNGHQIMDLPPQQRE